jgi:hypothetical protein
MEAPAMLTHYTLDDTSARAYCGHRMTEADRHSPFPTCGGCAATLRAEIALEEAIDETPFPLDADEAATQLDPVLNAGVPVPVPPQPAFNATAFVADLFAFAATLNRTYAEQLVKGGR